MLARQIGERFGQGAWCAMRFEVWRDILLYTVAEMEMEIDMNIEMERRDRYTARDRTDSELDRCLLMCYVHWQHYR